MTDTAQNPHAHTEQTENIRVELQIALQRTLLTYGDLLSEAEHPYVANVVLGEVAALLGDTIWNIHDNHRTHEPINGESLGEFMFRVAIARATEVYEQMETDTNIFNVGIQ